MEEKKSEKGGYDKELQGISFNDKHLSKPLDDEIFTTEEYEASEHEDTESDEGESLSKKRYNYTLSLNTEDDTLYRYRHVRKDVKPKYYKIAHSSASPCYMSKKTS